MSAEALVDSIGLALPSHWVHVPLGHGEFEDFARSQRRRLSELPKVAGRRLELVLRQLRNDCRRDGVTLAAVLAEPIPGGLLAATCTVAVLDQAALGTDMPLTLHTLAAATTRHLPGQHVPGQEELTVADLAAPRNVELADGPAVELRRLHTISATGGCRLSVLAHHTLVPYDAGRRAAAITLATPNLELAAPLGALFGEIASTFRTFAGEAHTHPTR